MDKQSKPQIENWRCPPVKIQPLQSTSLKELTFLCQDDDWFMNFIQDTEANQMIPAPPQMEISLMEKAEKQQHSSRFQLIQYSIKVSLAAAGAIVMLFTTPFFPKQPLFQTTPPDSAKSAFPASQDFVTFPHRDMEQQLKTRFWQLSDSIYDFSSELLEGGILHD